MKVTDEMVNRFLSWPLPASVRSDDCATVQGYPHRSGTTLLTADEARQMLEHVLQDGAALTEAARSDTHWLAKVREACERSPLFKRFLSVNFWDAHHVDLLWRHNGKDVREEADWLSAVFYAVRRHEPGKMPPPESMPPGVFPDGTTKAGDDRFNSKWGPNGDGSSSSMNSVLPK